MTRKFLLAGLATAIIGGPLLAADTAPLEPATLLEEFSKVPSATARFDETRRLAGAQTAMQSRGVLRYTAPDRLVRETEHPSRERSIVDGHLLTLERTVEGKLTRRSLPLEQLPTLDAFFTGLRATLSGNQRALEEIFSIQLTGEVTAWRMVLKPRAGTGPSSVSEIRLQGASASIRRIEVDEANGDTVRTILTPMAEPGPQAPPAEPGAPG